MTCPECGKGQLIYCRNMHITRKYQLTDGGEPIWNTENEEVNDDDDAWVECSHCDHHYDWDWVDMKAIVPAE